MTEVAGLTVGEPGALPPSVAEWEELLVRLEIAPRALRMAVEELPPGDHPAVRRRLAEAVAGERTALAHVDALRDGAPLEAAPSFEDDAGDAGEGTAARAAEFARLRARLFARVQRRGLEVPAWTSPLPGGGGVTAYAYLGAVVRRDGETLAAVRRAVRGEGGAC